MRPPAPPSQASTTTLASPRAPARPNDKVTDQDDSSYFGSNPCINIDKVTFDDGVSGDGIRILSGEPMGWRYTVTNTGNVPLSNVMVTDSKGVTPAYVSGDTNGDQKLDTTETWIFEAPGTSAVDAYSNVGTAHGTGPANDHATDTDDSSYTGLEPKIAIDKVTVDGATSGDGLTILPGKAITWRYTVTNVGNTPLANVNVTDSEAGVSPAYVSGDTNTDGMLDLNETWIFEASGTSVAGHYTNTGTATGTAMDTAGHTRDATDSDDSWYNGAAPSAAVIKVTVDASVSGDGIKILSGEPITWRYTVTNDGVVPLSSGSRTPRSTTATSRSPATWVSRRAASCRTAARRPSLATSTSTPPDSTAAAARSSAAR